MFIIKEKGTDNYVSEMSFGKHNKEGTEWMYSIYTGRCTGMRYYQSVDGANRVINILEEKANNLRLNKQYEPMFVYLNQLPIGFPVRTFIH